MNQRGAGGCCIARYAGAAAASYDMSKIMLRFRPIAPKPASADGSVSAAGSTRSATAESAVFSVKTGRGKRRGPAVAGGGNTTGVKKRRYSRKRKQRLSSSSSPENTDSGGSLSGGWKDMKTLALLPEAPSAVESRRLPLWLSLGNGGDGGEIAADHTGLLGSPKETLGRRTVVVRSLVKVECVTDAWAVGGYVYGGMGHTDEGRVRCLDMDTCPGFVSDGVNRVTWTNAAYRRMAGEGEVVVEEGAALPVGSVAFTCRVRVVTCGKEKIISQTAPCDVWRMDCGGFAWRVDTTAALSLGR